MVELSSAPPPLRRTLQTVQVMRGVAALAVVAYHTHLILAQPEYGGREIFADWAAKGWVGVNFFFVLSGFIILSAHRADIGVPRAVPRYVWRRFVRLFPLYWIGLTAYVVAAWIGLGAPDFGWSWTNLAAAYLLIETGPGQTLPLKVAWTLLYELRFYIAFIALLLSPRIGLALMGAWLVGIAVSATLLPGLGGSALSLWNIYFFFGMGACLLLPRIPDILAWPVLLAAVLVLILALAPIHFSIGEGEKSAPLLLALALGFTLLLVGAVALERSTHFSMPWPLMLIGDASYSIYLVHSATLSVLALLAHRVTHDALPGPLLFALAFGLSSLAGIVVHVLIERPLLQALRHRSPVRPAATTASGDPRRHEA
ncbi:acyltransferase [Devosia sp. PTR5]|uniref:Acyltransferase n=1 Tax=Devosia oryzisoli TaxID=2774138 RepID=A0A927FWY3_9HYPH|nr:acyltransferase [Devosia oryzisoli]MBD8066792.1 acyltransferase [Devosia oryzisoli]